MSLRRLRCLCAALVLLTGIVLCRTYWVGQETAYAAGASAQTVGTVELPRARGNFYDRNGRKLTGRSEQLYAICLPGDNADYTALFPYVSYAGQRMLYEKRNTAAPFAVELSAQPPQSEIVTFRVTKHLPQSPLAVHLLGYLDSEGSGVSGLEAAYQEVLAGSAPLQAVRCGLNARGGLLYDQQPELLTLEEGTGQGVRLTLDADLQAACEGLAMQLMPRGCLVVADVQTGEVLACVSMPRYDPNDIASSIRANDTSLIDRSLAAFSAGSVFKVVLAAAALENGLDWYTHECTGSVELAGQTYRCAQGKAHGEVNLRGALEQSCNTYFIELGQLLGAETILSMAEKFGFGSAVQVAPGMAGSAGQLPDRQQAEKTGELALLSFGQGQLMATPLQITAMMNTVAGDGVWQPLRLVQGVTDASGAVTEPYEITSDAVRVCSASSAQALRRMLRSVVENGIGYEAAPAAPATAGGKTGTAQTGQFDADGAELLNYWFSGFYPADAPRYTITIVQDAVRKPETSSAALFRRVTEILDVWEGGEKTEN